MRKYGAENFTAQTLFEFETNQEAIAKEIELIALWQTNIARFPDGLGMNMTDGGEGTEGYRHTSETKEIIRKTSIGRKRSAETQEIINKLIEKRGSYWNKGRKSSPETRKKQSDSLKSLYASGARQPRHEKHSDETKRKMSLAHKGKKLTEAHRLNISNARKGIKFSEEHRKKISKLLTGRKQSAETIEKRVSKFRGKKSKPRSQEFKEKRSALQKEQIAKNGHPMFGKKHSDESREKMRASRMAYMERQKANCHE